MLKKRIIPKLLCVERFFGSSKKMVLVNTQKFSGIRLVGEPVSQAKIYESQICDELVVTNIKSGFDGIVPAFLDTVQRLASETFMPLTVGGGVRTVDDFELLLKWGADKITINDQAIANPGLITAAAKSFGCQCVVVSIDHKKNNDGEDRVYSHRTKTLLDICPLEWAKECVAKGAGEILLTDVDRDGMKEGLNVELCQQVTELLPVPVVISGGCGLAQHFIDGFVLGKAEGVAAGTFFSKRDQNPMQLRSHVSNAKIPVRMDL